MEAAEAQSRRGLEETVRLLDEALEKMTVRAEREAKERHTAERLAAAVQGELNALQKEMSIRFNTQQAEESDKLQRELRERAAAQRLESALADRQALELIVQELRGESEVLAQRLEAEGRARAALGEQLSMAAREAQELRERQAQQQQAGAEAAEAYRTLEFSHREAVRRAEESAAEASEAKRALKEARGEYELLQKRHAAELDARQGQQAADQLRSEELAEARRGVEVQSKLVAELQKSEAGLASSAQSYRNQLQQVINEKTELQREAGVLSKAVEEGNRKVVEAERAREAAVAGMQRAVNECNELKGALDASAARERLGEAQREELHGVSERLRGRLEAEAKARAALDDALRLRGQVASRPSLPPASLPLEPPTREPPPSAAPPTVATAARAVSPIKSDVALARERLSASGSLLHEGTTRILEEPDLVDRAGVLTGYECAVSAGDGTQPPTPLMPHNPRDSLAADVEEARSALARVKEEMKLTNPTAPSPFEPQLRAVREALAGTDLMPGQTDYAARDERMENTLEKQAAAVAASPLEARKKELSEELKRLKARLQPMGPPPPKPPPSAMDSRLAASAASVAAEPLVDTKERLAAAGCDPACSPIGRLNLPMSTPATQAAMPTGGSSMAQTPRSPALQPESGIFARPKPTAPSAMDSKLAAAARKLGSTGSSGQTLARSSGLGDLESSQKLLEDKLAALKKKLEDPYA